MKSPSKKKALLKRSLKLSRDFLKHCYEDEEGGSMVFGAITMFTLVVFVVLIMNTGMLSSDKMAMQNSADAAAYSGAVVGANSLNSVAAINDGMALIYYSLMRYNVDIITFGVLKEMEVHNQFAMVHPKGYYSKALGQGLPDVLEPINPKIPDDMLYPQARDTAGNIDASRGFAETYKKIRERAERLIPRGLDWIESLAETERLIARATPRIMKEVIFNVAKANGAERVAIFPPLNDDFFIGGRNSLLKVGDLSRDIAGVPGDSKFLLAFTERYQDKPVLYRTPMELPTEWYSPLHGRSKGADGFFQVRICWNRHDVRHGAGDRPTHKGSPLMGPFVQGSPNGHWHGSHDHLVVDPFLTEPPKTETHFGGHGNAFDDYYMIMPPGVDPRVHIFAVDKAVRLDWEHHEKITCPTCFATDSTSPLDYPDIRVTERLVNEDYGNLDVAPHTIPRNLRELYPRAEGRAAVQARQPLVLTENIITHGINVAVHRKSRPTMLGSLFPVPGWGMIGTASARMGLFVDTSHPTVKRIDIKGDQGTWLRQLKNSSLGPEKIFENNYLSKETYFSARLAPMNLASYGPAVGGGNNSGVAGLNQLLTQNLWQTTPDGGPDATGQKIAEKLKEQLSFTPPLQANINH